MWMIRLLILFFIVASFACKRSEVVIPVPGTKDFLSTINQSNYGGKCALLLTRFNSLAAFKEVVDITYASTVDSNITDSSRQWVQLIHHSGGRTVISVLKSGVSQADFMRARKGTLWEKIRLGMKCPFAYRNRKSLAAIESLGRRRPWDFGKGDVAFYDLAENMVHHLRAEDTIAMSADDLSEKGYLNTFNHITAQAFMTSAFDETTADFVADVHELFNMPSLVSGHFTDAQLTDLKDGPVDNYIDMVNNEWGQELGKELGAKYKINRHTFWTPELLAAYLNDIQTYYSWAFQIGFLPFKTSDEMVIRFADKINKVKP